MRRLRRSEAEKVNGIISCDLIGHGLESVQVQAAHISAINDIVRETIARSGKANTIWASAGDGGHVVLKSDDWANEAIDLILALHGWSCGNVPLRITAHCGPILKVKGADGRVQVVGDAINFCGSLLAFGSPHGVVISEAFRAKVEQAIRSEVRFHDERIVYLKHFSAQRLCLMSIEQRVQSRWGMQSASERHLLMEALTKLSNGSHDEGLNWSIIYHAKRLLQVNPSDPDATEALTSIHPAELRNPFLATMDKPTFRDFVKMAQLVERQDSEIICEYDEHGDAMFLIINGEVGVISRHIGGHEVTPVGAPFLDRKFSVGEIVGELALYLKRKRTATLQAIGRTCLLSFNYENLESLLRDRGTVVKVVVQGFFETRVLEHLCNHTEYLSVALAGKRSPWDLIRGSETMTLAWNDPGTISPEHELFARNGLYILASGTLEKQLGGKGSSVILEGEHLPVVYADFAGHFVNTNHNYSILSDTVKVVYLPESSLQVFGRECFGRLVAEMKRVITKYFTYDVFISYNNKDQDVACRWKAKFEEAGLAVYMNTLDPMHRFKPQIADAIRDSLLLLALVSSNTAEQAPNESWVGREIQYRGQIFHKEANILPVRLSGGSMERVGEGFSPIMAVGREPEAIQEAISVALSVQAGKRSLPFALNRVTGLNL
ncbi:MAG: cyclic nucleotide-binding domain-containing protein [Deltaproteobacteria bacterium]|nr:cyclic nucleotide-binding domain-containing protein [Deltaproteobacteria bacterium]